jgi:site-specific recombinase XerD
MLELFFKCPSTLERLRGNPLGAHLESYAVAASGLGYRRSTVRSQIQLLAKLGVWLRARGLGVADLDEGVIDRFRARFHCRKRHRRGDVRTLHRFLEHLRGKSLIPLPEHETDKTPLGMIKRRYDTYLVKERGALASTGTSYWRFIGCFLEERFGDRPIKLEELCPLDISRFLLRHAHCRSPKSAQLMVAALRSFFRFLFQHGDTENDLSGAVPTVPSWKLSEVPKFLKPQEIERLLQSCNRNTATGRRNYAVLLLLTRLGLRAGEVVNLELDDIDWRSGELTVRGKGKSRDRLPLPRDVGQALATYLRRDRPRCSTRRVFVLMRAPRRGFHHPSTVSTIVSRALKRAGLNPPIKGAHLLRHSLATGMLRSGSSMAEIGQVLRHWSPNSTEIYAKVDVEGLRSIARPWPGTGGQR